jgi:hypothetical protein
MSVIEKTIFSVRINFFHEIVDTIRMNAGGVIMKRLVYIPVALMLLCSIVCELPQNPRNIDNAGIVKETLTAIPDIVPVNSVYSCTLVVKYPEFVDSFSVLQSVDSGAPEKIAGAPLDGDTLLLFKVHLSEPALFTLSLLVYKGDQVDSVTETVAVFSTTPVVSATQRKVVTPVDSSAVLRFDAVDPDSNLLEYYLSNGATVVDTQQFRASERAASAISKELTPSFLTGLDDTLKVFSVIVMDEDSQQSASALCTLIIRDTVFPAITRLPPLGDSIYTVKKLPDTLRVTVRDNWDIDSVKLGGRRVIFSGGDTVQLVVNGLDSGITAETLEAWDPAGNRSTERITFRYEGARVYLPEIAYIVQTVDEGGIFDTVHLDAKVTITDPDAAYGKDALQWSMVRESVDTGMTVEFDAEARTLYVAGPSGELFDDRVAVLSLTVTDPAGYSNTQHGVTFIMVEKNDPPHITLKGQGKIFGTVFDTLKLDTCGYDPEMNARLSWTIDRGAYFYPDFLSVTRCTGLVLGKTASKLPLCFDIPTGKVLIKPDSTAVAKVPTSQMVIADTLRFHLKSVTGTDTVETSRKIPFTWGRLQIIVPIEIPAEIYQKH